MTRTRTALDAPTFAQRCAEGGLEGDTKTCAQGLAERAEHALRHAAGKRELR